MDESDELLICRVCGLRQASPPWGQDGNSPTYEFCPCCGVEFGYGDATVVGTKRWRESWLSAGAKWFESDSRPSDWDADAQLAQLPDAYR